MKPRTELFLHEELLLLALHDKRGTIVSGTWYGQALAGAILTELLLRGNLQLGQGNRIEVIHHERIGEPLLDACLASIAEAKKSKDMRWWISKIANRSDLKHGTAEGLIQRGILRGDKDKVLLLFERRIYPEVDPGPERELIERLRNAIHGGTNIDPRTVVVLSLAYNTSILKVVFDKQELRSQKKRIQQVISSEAAGQAAAEVVQAMQAALVVSAAMVPIISS